MAGHSRLLSVVVEKEGHSVYIHADAAGLALLEEAVQRMRGKLERGECDHDHFFSEDWGSDELSLSMLDDEKRDGCVNVHHVKIYAWTEEWKVKHGLAVETDPAHPASKRP